MELAIPTPGTGSYLPSGYSSAIEPHRSQEVEVQLDQPLIIGDDGESTRRCRRTSDDMNQDVECAGLGGLSGHRVGADDRDPNWTLSLH